MNRRHLLRSAGALAAAGLAGCAGGRPDAPTDTPAATPEQPQASFAVTSARCGAQVNRASVTFGDATVTVEGTTWGNDACYTARLGSVTTDRGTLTLRVTAERRADVQGCAQCITELDYRATVEVERTPAEVVVVHRRETVTTFRRP